MSLENPSNYSNELDPNGRIALTSVRSSFNAITRNETAYNADNKGVDRFDGDFEILFEGKTTGGSVGGVFGPLALANILDDRNSIRAVNGYVFTVAFAKEGAGNNTIYLIEEVVGSVFFDFFTGSENTLYYFKVKRVGTGGFLYIYSDALRTTLIDVLNVSLHTIIKLQFFYTAQTFNDSDANTLTGYGENYDLGEAVEAIKPFRKLGQGLYTGLGGGL